MDIDAAVARIAYVGSREPTLETLRDLQQAFLLTVPFENLDIHWGREILMSPERGYTKIVEEHRGGFCYECNGLFARMLEALGFRVTLVSARMTLTGAPSPEFAHMALVVTLEEPYLVDVGNGQSCREPLRLDGMNESTAEGLTYRVETQGDDLALLFRRGEDDWLPRFLFTTQPRGTDEFAAMCAFQQVAPDSIFVKGRIVTMATPDGRKTLVDTGLRIEHANGEDQISVDGEAAYRAALAEHFGIAAPEWVT